MSNHKVVQVTFQGTHAYTLVPHHWPYLADLAGFARERPGYGNMNSGIGLEYPTRAERAGQVRIWYWDWGTRKLKARKYIFLSQTTWPLWSPCSSEYTHTA